MYIRIEGQDGEAQHIDLTSDDDPPDDDHVVSPSNHVVSPSSHVVSPRSHVVSPSSHVVTTFPSFSPAPQNQGYASFSMMDAPSLPTSQSTIPTLVPRFLIDANTKQIQDLTGGDSQSSTTQTHGVISPRADTTSVASTSSDTGFATPQRARRGRGRGRGRRRSTNLKDFPAGIRTSYPINPYRAVQFNREFYGRNKTRIVLKRHICQVCGKRMLKKSDLERHTRVHTGERPFRCPLCSRSYKQENTLKHHVAKCIGDITADG